jgi:LAS superfamily LD-carboxypeptidase LdcB
MMKRQIQAFKPFLQGVMACAVLVVGIENAFGEKIKPYISPHDRKLIVSILHTLGPLIKDKQRSGSAPLLRWSELIQPLDSKQRILIERFRRFSNEADDDNDPLQPPLVRLDNQSILKNGRAKLIPPQYVTRAVYDAYTWMSQNMQNDLGTTLRIESGYRSPAYQLYLYLSHLPRYRFDLAKTHRHVALPGRSEHGSLQNPAIDFINAAGVNGEYNPKKFALLAEYRWLTLNAEVYGFKLSFPEATLYCAFEPWHWRYCQ